MKRVLLLATGGTIATVQTDEGLTPQLTSHDLLGHIPELEDICSVEALQLFNLDSTNLTPEHWLEIARAIHRHYDEFDGFVVTHGTDTMAYTAAALSYLIQKSRKPIVLTGAQRSIDNRETDARRNLLDALRYAASDTAWGVTVVFDGHAILGTRARKMRTKSYHAFASIGYPEQAMLRDSSVYPILPCPFEGGPQFRLHLNPRVFVLKLFPGIRASLPQVLLPEYDALILEGFGTGGVPSYADEDFICAISRWTAAGKPVIMTTQVTYEGSDLEVYQTGHVIKTRHGVLEARDMTLEAALTKTMWLLADSREPGDFARRFHDPVQADVLLPE